MDLGFGQKNQVLGSAATSAILRTTQAQEQALEQEISQYDSLMMAGDEQLEMLRERRLAQMKAAQAQKRKYLDQGHGTYTSLGEGRDSRDVAKDFFDVAKQSERLLAQRHVETKFVKINMESCEDGGGGAGNLG
eukprot:scaffold1870_cov48-Attheya_sp.AAC.1